MRLSLKISLLPTLALISACSGGGSEASGEGQVAPTAQKETPAPAPEKALSEVAKKGKIVFLKCRSCHTVDKGGVHLTGPNLHGFIGQKAGTREGYAYSPALKETGLVWDDATLDQWYISPSKTVPGTKMVFAGLPNEEDRAALTAYLKEVTTE